MAVIGREERCSMLMLREKVMENRNLKFMFIVEKESERIEKKRNFIIILSVFTYIEA